MNVKIVRNFISFSLISTLFSVGNAMVTSGSGGSVAVIHHVNAVEGGTAQLPCDLSSNNHDRVVLIVWYKKEHTPIYSYDLRSSAQAKHWRGESLETRAFFRTTTEPAYLTIDNINSGRDEGEYRCRIDYSKSATRNQRVNLNIIVPPLKPKIFNENGVEINSIAGPYEEGGDMKLTCIVTGGKPQPVIQWYRGGNLLESTDVQSGFPNAHANQLMIKGLNRSHLHASLTCRTSNNNLSIPLQTTIKLEMNFRPVSVEILTSNNPFSAGRKYELTCQTYGSRPTPKITWLIAGKELKPPRYSYNQTDTNNGNSSISILHFTSTRHENGLKLTCRASNDRVVRGGTIETSMKLNIFYTPLPTLTLGSNLNPDDIEEGDDVYFECKVNSNPWAYKVLWKHNGRVMQHNRKAGVIMSTSDLALQGITKNQMGNYSCVASNVEGDGESNVVNLKIMYKPVCKPVQKRLYGVGRHETARVLCEVDSYPPPDHFKWAFNNSAESIDVPQTRYHSETHRLSSTLTYTPITDLDYGTVMCWASNLAGKQQEPCVFHIVTAGKPDPPSNCTVSNSSNSATLDVTCNEGFDGGVPQQFILEVFDQSTEQVLTNITSNSPLFNVYGLQTGKLLKLVIYSINAKGKSEHSVIFEGYTLSGAEKRTVLLGGFEDQLDLAPLVGLLAGFVVMLLVLSLATLMYVKLKTSRRCKRTLEQRVKTGSCDEIDEKNPDLIPTYREGEQFEVCSSVLTPLSEAFMARSGEQTSTKTARRPCNLDVKNGTMAAHIDDDRRGIPPSIISPSFLTGSKHHQGFQQQQQNNVNNREVVTIRAPLLGFHQESCV